MTITDLLALATAFVAVLLLGVQVVTRWARTEIQLPDGSRGTNPAPRG